MLPFRLASEQRHYEEAYGHSAASSILIKVAQRSQPTQRPRAVLDVIQLLLSEPHSFRLASVKGASRRSVSQHQRPAPASSFEAAQPSFDSTRAVAYGREFLKPHLFQTDVWLQEPMRKPPARKLSSVTIDQSRFWCHAIKGSSSCS